MPIIKYKPTNPGLRHVVRIKKVGMYKGRPYKKLLTHIKRSHGRNNYGRITTRHIGGGHKRRYRIIDFYRNKDDISAKVQRIEYDPNRSSNIALLLYKDGERRYILSPKGLQIGNLVISGENSPIKMGNCLPLLKIPVGTFVHCIELKPGKGAQLVRTAGGYAQILSEEDKYVTLRLKSGEIRKINSFCRATIGEIGNNEHMLIRYGKAGASRWRGIRPTVRGTAMNPIDHPHGGGEGKNFGKHPVTPWGQSTKGKKTRRNKRTERFILRHCHR